MSIKTETKSRAKRGKQTAPTQTTMNLMIKEKSPLRLSVVIPAVLVIVVLAFLFGKFAVADRFTHLREAEDELAARQDWLNALELSCADYDEVKEQYNQYTYKGFDRSIADRQDILDLLETDILPYSESRSVSVSGNIFSTTLTGLTLDEVSSMIARLEANPLVKRVTVSTAGYNDDRTDEVEGFRPYATMTIEFTNAEGGDQ